MEKEKEIELSELKNRLSIEMEIKFGAEALKILNKYHMDNYFIKSLCLKVERW